MPTAKNTETRQRWNRPYEVGEHLLMIAKGIHLRLLVSLLTALFFCTHPQFHVHASRPIAPTKITILYMNDPHGRYVPRETKSSKGLSGGFAKAQTVFKEVQRAAEGEGRHTLILLGGDLLMGSIYSTIWKGTVGVELMNEMGFTAMVVGNHEFDYGFDNLLDNLLPNMRFPLLSANIKIRDGSRPFKSLLLKEIPESGERILIIGLTAADTPITTLPSNVADLVFEHPATAARRILSEYGDDYLVIALTHLGLDNDRKLALAVPRIDVIVGGHSHDALFKPERAGNALICQAGAYAGFVGRLDLDIMHGRIVRYRGELIPLNAEVGQDPEIASVLEKYTAKLDSRLNNVIGRTDVFLDGTDQTLRSGKPSNLGQLVARIMAINTNAEAALVNGGSIRGSIGRGRITLGQAYEILPFPNTVVRIKLKGRDIQAILEKSATLPPGSGGKLQVYGILFEPAQDRMVISRIGRRTFEPESEYSIAVNDFLLAGGDGYNTFHTKGTKVLKTGLSVRDLFVGYLKDERVITH